MGDQSKALPKVGMPKLELSVISDTRPHSKARYRVYGLMVSDQCRMRLPQNLGQIHDEENNLDVLVFCAGIERSMAFYRYALACTVQLLRPANGMDSIQRRTGHRHDVRGDGAGHAPCVAGAQLERTGQDVPPAQVARHRRSGRCDSTLAVGAGYQVGRRLGLADAPGAQAPRSG